MPSEKRCTERTTIVRSLLILSSDITIQAKLLNISNCGVGVICPSKLPVGDYFSLQLTLPSYDQDNKLTLKAQTVHLAETHEGFLIGFKFIEPSQHSILVIREFFNFHHRFQA